MNRTLKASIAAVLLGTATLSIAQTPAESFADRIKQFQTLSGAGPAFKPQPTFSNAPKAPAPRLSDRGIPGNVLRLAGVRPGRRLGRRESSDRAHAPRLGSANRSTQTN